MLLVLDLIVVASMVQPLRHQAVVVSVLIAAAMSEAAAVQVLLQNAAVAWRVVFALTSGPPGVWLMLCAAVVPAACMALGILHKVMHSCHNRFVEAVQMPYA